MEQRAQVVVVGSGAGAAAVVQPLVQAGVRVVVLERGDDLVPAPAPDPGQAGRGIAPLTELPNAIVDAAGAPVALFSAEGAALGGGTAVYTGNVLRFHPDDFRRRTMLGDVAGAQLADWPLSYDELEPFYDELEREMGVAGDARSNPFEPRRSAPFPLPPVPLDRAGELADAAARTLGWHPYPIPTIASAARGRNACVRCGLCTAFLCTVNARWSARAGLVEAHAAGRLSLELGATATRVVMKDGRARGVEWLDRQGALRVTEADVVVLAANAIQTPRLLMQSGDLANGSGQVGRNLMTHVMEGFVTLGHVPGEQTTRAAGCTLAVQDLYASDRSGAPLHITLEPRTIGHEPAFRRFLAQDPSTSGLSDAELHARFVANVAVMAMMEDVPRAENRVRLHPTLRDPRGLPVPVVDHEPHALDLQTAEVGARAARTLLEAAGARDIITVAPRTARFHAMGTCRMGTDPSTSVVNRDGRTHEVDNLYVADSSVLVTSAGVNPSLTVQAVARRIGKGILSAPRR